MRASPAVLRAREKKAALLAAVNGGQSLGEARSLLNIDLELYKYYRSSDPAFRHSMDDARQTQAFLNEEGWQGDFATFRDTFFRYEYPTPSFHMEIIKKLEQAPPLSITMILVPPNHGKSSLLEDWVNYKLALDPNRRITLVSKSQNHARKMLGRIQRRMADPLIAPAYLARFGPFIDDGGKTKGLTKPWTRDYFTVAKSDHDEADYSVQSLGWTGQVYGSRIDDLILDDIQTRDNLTQVDSMLAKLRGEFLNRGDEKFRAFIIGTFVEMNDIYARLLEEGSITADQVFVMPALNHNGESLWPERWPPDKLAKVRALVGERAWWCNYMLKPSLGGSATFTEQMTDDCKDSLRGLGRGPGNLATHGLPVVLHLDPALGGGNALFASAYSTEAFHVLDAQVDYGLARTEDILDRIEQFAIRYAPLDLVIEINAFQRGLGRDERLEAMSHKYGFRIHEHTTHRNKLDPVLGVGAMAGSFLRREISFPWADPIAQAKMEPVMKELNSWRPNIPARILTQDLVMALWFGWLWWIQRRKIMKLDIGDWKRPGIMGAPTPTPALTGMPRGVSSIVGNHTALTASSQ